MSERIFQVIYDTNTFIYGSPPHRRHPRTLLPRRRRWRRGILCEKKRQTRIHPVPLHTYGTFIYVRTRVYTYTLKWRHVRALMRGAARKVLSNHRNTASYGAINFFSLRSNKFSAPITSAIHLYFIWLMKIEILSAKKKVLKSEDCSYIVEIARRQLVYLRSLPHFLFSGSVFRFFPSINNNIWLLIGLKSVFLLFVSSKYFRENIFFMLYLYLKLVKWRIIWC